MVASLVVPAFLQFYVVPPQVAMASPDTVTYYFNAYGAEVWEDSPASMTDDNLDTYASTNNAGEFQLNNANNCSGTGLGPISKVELRAYGYGDGGDFIYLRPVFTAGDGTNHTWTPGTSPGWSPYYNITSDTNAPTSWNWSNVQELDVDVVYDGLAKPNPLYIAKVEIWVTYTPNVPPTVDEPTVTLSMTPQSQAWVNVTITDNNKLSDLSTVETVLFYDADGSYTDPGASPTPDTQTLAIMTWYASNDTFAIQSGSPSTWSIDNATCTHPALTEYTGDWKFSFQPGKVATETTGKWFARVNATDSASEVGSNHTTTGSDMQWYGEITVSTATVDFGTVDLGSAFATNNKTATVKNIANGNYNEEAKTDDGSGNGKWLGVTANVTLNTAGTPGSGEFSLAIDDTTTLASSVNMSTAYQAINSTGVQTGEAGYPSGDHGLWLALGAAGIEPTEYSGTIYFQIANG